MMSRLHNLERSIANQGQVPGDATNAVTVSYAHKGLMLVVNATVVKLFILSLTCVFKVKSSESVERVLMARRLGPQEGLSQLPSLRQALNTHPPIPWHLRTCSASSSGPLLPKGVKQK